MEYLESLPDESHQNKMSQKIINYIDYKTYIIKCVFNNIYLILIINNFRLIFDSELEFNQKKNEIIIFL